MKKALFALIPALLFASCSFWNEPVEEFFSYWSSEAFITDSSVKVPNQSDKAGVPSVSSDTDSEIILKMSNPKSFRFIMPSAGNSEMIRFKGLETQPSAGTDYKLEQLSSETLKLTYSTQFLKKHEWGNGDLGATLTLFADDGRKFKKPYGFNLKANTPPPTPTAVLAQTAASSYVLCFKVPDMGVMVNGERLHKDIAQIEINGTKYPLTVESSDFKKPDDPHFILAGGVTQLTEPHSAPVPAGAWVLYYNTGVPLGAGHQAYTVKLKDDKDLVSNTLETGTTLNEPPAEIITVTAGEQSTGSGTDAAPFIIKGAASSPEAQIKIENTAAGTTVHCTVTKVVGTAAPARYDGNPVTFPLGLDSADEKTYKVEYYTDGIGYKSNAVKTKYYKVLKQHTVTFNANGGTYSGGATTRTALVPHTMTATAPAATDNPTRTGYTFGNWYKEAACTTQWNFTSDTVTGDITLYAQWNPASGTGYKVEHYQEKTDGVGQYPASPHETDNLTGTTGANISVTPKTYPGFEFDKQEPASPSIAADGSTVVKVYYRRKSITVTFNLNGGNIGGSMTAQTRTGRFGTALTAPANPVKTGYTFSSWQPVGAEPLLSSTFPASDATYTAQWVANTNTPYKVKHLKQNINDNNYTEVTADAENNLQGTTGTNVAVTPKTYTGFEAGTYTSATIAADGSTVIEVRYNRKVYTVTFNTNGGTPASQSQNVRYEGKVSTPSISKTGYTFGGWYESSTYTGAAWNFASNTITVDITLYAKWNPRNDTQYIVKHFKQDVTGSGYTEVAADRQTLQGTTDAAPTVPLKTYTGFQAGSYTPTTIAADGSTVIEVRYNRKVYTVTFNTNGGTPASQSQNVRYEGKVSTPSISKTGYTFGGWYESSTYTGAAWNFTTDTVTGNTNLHAKWTANTYKVKFNSNGGSGSMNDQPFTYGTAQNLTANTFTKTNSRFTGWATSPTSSTVVHTDKKSVNNLTTTNGDVVNLYAVWVPLPKVTFKVEGGKGGTLKCTYNGEMKEASGNTENSFIVEYSTTKSAVFTAVPDSGWALAEWYINPGPFNDGSQSTALERAVTLIVSDVTVTVKFRH